MALHNIQDQWIYLMEPHTASRATVSVLTKLGGSQIGSHHHSLKQLTGRDRREVANLDNYDIIACTVRNPFDVLVTRWRFGPGKNDPFYEWAWDNRDHPIVADPLRGLWKEANSWIYYEHLQPDLEYVFGTEIDLGYDLNHKTDSKEHWSTYYTDDQELWDYLMDGQYGQFCAMFGYHFHQSEGSLHCSVDPVVRKRRTRRIKRVRGLENA